MRNGNGSRARQAHHGLGMILALGALLLLATGAALMHPHRLGRAALGPTAVGADPAQPGRLLRASPALLEESVDDGRTWRDLPLMLAPQQPVALAFAPAGDGGVWLLGHTDLLRSADGGAVWEPVPLPEAVSFSEPPVALTVDPDGRPVVATAHGAWIADRTTPAGWRELWRVPPTRADRWRDLARRLHSGRGGPPFVARVYDAGVVLFLVVVVTGLVLGLRRRRRRP